MTSKRAGIGAAIAALLALPAAARADAVEDFYRGREVSMIVTGSPGSNYEVYARLIGQGLTRHLPGRPNVVIRGMNGGGHMIGVNHLYNVAPRDGSVIGAIGETIPLIQLLEPERVKYDAARFNWIGNPTVANLTLAVWHTAGVTRIEQLRDRELIVGSSGPTSPSGQIPRALSNVLGLKLKIIMGFPGSQIDLAMERGEVEARGSAQYEWWRTAHSDWLAEKKIHLLLQVGVARDPEIPDVPLLTELARNDAERQIFRLISSTVALGRPVVAPPDVPAERVAALRQAFDATMRDPQFLAETARVKLEVKPVPAAELQAMVEELIRTPKEVVTLAKAALSDGKTFKCTELVKDPKLCEGGGE